MDKVMGMVMKARMRHLEMQVGVLANFYGSGWLWRRYKSTTDDVEIDEYNG